MKYRGWECTQLELELLTAWGAASLANWHGEIHPIDHLLAINGGWEPSQSGLGFSKQLSPKRRVHVHSGSKRSWGFRRHDGRQIWCRTIVSAMAKAWRDASEETNG